MPQTSKPSNEQLRSWMQQRQADRTPPPSPDEIRPELDWGLVEAARNMTTNRNNR